MKKMTMILLLHRKIGIATLVSKCGVVLGGSRREAATVGDGIGVLAVVVG